MEYEHDLLNWDLFQAKHIVVMKEENHVQLNNKQYEQDQRQNCTKRDYFHSMDYENDVPMEQHIHHLNQHHNFP